MIPAHDTTKTVGRQPKPPLWPDPWMCPYSHSRNQLGATLPQTLVPPASKQGHLLLVGHLFLIFTPLCCSMSPNKALPEFLI